MMTGSHAGLPQGPTRIVCNTALSGEYSNMSKHEREAAKAKDGRSYKARMDGRQTVLIH